MGLVIDGMFALAIVAAGIWLWTLRGSVTRDRAAAREAALQSAQSQERAAREARLYRDKVPLRCLGCDTQFLGPLTEMGCPQCHLSSLIITESEYQSGRAGAANVQKAGE